GRTYNSANKKEMAIPLFKEAFELAQKNKADFYAIDAAHMLGIAEKPDQQLRWNLKAVELTEKSNEHRAKKWLGPLYNNIGWTYHDKGDYREAMHFFEKSLEWREAQNDQKGAFIAKWCIARNYRSMNEIEAALDIQEALLSEMKADSSKTDPYVYEELGECHLLKKDSTSARRYFKLAYAILSKDKWMQNNEPQRLERMLELSGNQK
ncbi:MAG: tetratricopeptide repeat protein, partial [Chitinophagales bacterium]